MTGWLVLGSLAVLIGFGAWLFTRATRDGPDRTWSDSQDDGRKQVIKTLIP